MNWQPHKDHVQVKKLHIVCGENALAETDDQLLWDAWNAQHPTQSILAWQDYFFEETKIEFLQLVNDVGGAVVHGRSVCEHLRLRDGFSVWWLSSLFERHPHFYGGTLFSLFKLRALEHYLEIVQPHSVHVSESCRDIQAIVDLCAAKGIPCTGPIVYSEKLSWAARLRARLGKSYLGCFWKTSRSLWRWWREERALFPAKPAVRPAKGILLGTWFPNFDAAAAERGIFRSRYWEGVHDVLNDVADPVHWLFIHADARDATRKNIQQRDTFAEKYRTYQDMTFWEECVTPRGAAIAFFQWILIARKARKLGTAVREAFVWPNSALNVFAAWEPLWKDATQGWYLLRQLLVREGLRAYSDLVGPQKMVLTSSEFQFWERMLFRVQRRCGCTNICAAVHTRISLSDFRYFCAGEAWNNPEFCELMPDMLYCNGAAALAAMRKSGFPEERLGMLEAVRFMDLAHTQPLPRVAPTTLLVVTSYFEKETKSMLRDLAQAMDSEDFPAFERVIVKPHPDVPVDAWLEEYFASPPQVVGGKIESYLTEGTIMFVAAGTSVALHALYLDMPMVVKAPQNDFDMGSLSNVAGVRYVQTAQDLLKALQSPCYSSVERNYFCLDADLARWRALLYQ